MSDSAPTTHSSQSLLLYKITTSVTYLLLVITTFYYTFNAPDKHDGRFWKHNLSTPFAQSSIITSIYWLVLFALQLAYAWSLYASNPVYVSAAANVGAHFVANNLLIFGFVNLFVRSHYILALVLLLINFFNLSFAYFRHSTTPRAIHIGVVSGPLAWNFVALYWVGALVVHTNHLAARIVANVFIWGWAGYGVFFLAAYKDYTMGYALSILSFCKFFALPFFPPLLIFASPSFKPSSSNISAKSMIATGTGQFLTRPHIFQFQWIFAFTIGALLFVLSTAVGVPGLLGRDPFPRGQIVAEDQERAPLLADE
jgi:hypothetical protein